MKTIVLIGAGMMGTALTLPAAANGNRIRVVGTPLDREIIEHAKKTHRQKTMDRKLPDENEYYQIEALDEALEGADFVISGVSSFGVDWLLNEALPHVPQDTPILSVTKGLVDDAEGRLETIPAYLERNIGRPLNICAIGGPCTAYELADLRQSCVTFCGKDMATLEMMREAMQTGYYHISLSTDVTGVECAVAMKNAYALAVTSAVGALEAQEGEGCKEAYNPQAGIFGQAVREMSRMLRLLGGKPENIMLAAGDLYVTVYGGRTRRLGILLGRGLSIADALAQLSGVTLESVSIATRTVRALRIRAARGEIDPADFPILMHIGDVLDGKCSLHMPWESFR
ncbi:MAG TPA: NAD(P)-binding domain-containing protein [Candidatus Aphodomonas merdavium]|nr:NAD(P)-binding domain-containing protein [Candidatus Aphodomonas merdavium]